MTKNEIIEYLETLPVKPRRANGKIKISIATNQLGQLVESSPEKIKEAQSWLTSRKLSIPFSRGNVLHLIKN